MVEVVRTVDKSIGPFYVLFCLYVVFYFFSLRYS